MVRVFTTVGDRLLGLLLGTRDAGACLPGAGDVCCVRWGHVSCNGHCG